MIGITMNELSKELDMNKSKLAFYMSRGLITPSMEVGGMYIFDKTVTKRKIKKIATLQRHSYTLKQIKILLKE